MENTLKSKNNPFLANNNGNNGTKPTVITPTAAAIIGGSPGRTRDRNVFITPPASAAMSLPLLRGLYQGFFFPVIFFLSFSYINILSVIVNIYIDIRIYAIKPQLIR